jgi:hypothetical protein
MWIYLKSPPSPSAPEREDSTLASNAGSIRSLTVNGTLTLKAQLSLVSETEHYPTDRFGMISQPSMAASSAGGPEPFTEASRVSLLATLEDAWHRSTPETSSLTCIASLKKLDPNMSLSKTFQGSQAPSPLYAYVAGLIDGEGCLGIQSTNSTQFYAEISIGMSDKALPLLLEVQKTLGGTVTKRREPTEKWNGAHTWRIGGDAALAFISEVGPFLILKREQYQVLMELKQLVENLEVVGSRRKWTPEASSNAAKVKQKMHLLNKKGPNAQNAVGGWYYPNPDLFGNWRPFSEKFPRWGMTVDGLLFQPKKLEPRSSEKDSSLWPRPVAAETGTWINRSLSAGAKDRPSLGAIAKTWRWPRPLASDAEKGGPNSVSYGEPKMAAIAARWARPTARDWKGQESPERHGQHSPSIDIQAQEIGHKGYLSPHFHAAMMGYSTDHTQLDAAGMAWFLSRQKKHLKDSLESKEASNG